MVKFALVIAFVFLAHFSQAQNSPQDYVNAHNIARSQVGVGPIAWDNDLATWAQNYVNMLRSSCQIVYTGGPYGQNLAWSPLDMSGTSAVGLWVAEKIFYNYNSNSCIVRECRRYTQVVWRKSVRVGCAKVRCENGSTIVSCNYNPPGNIAGMRPY